MRRITKIGIVVGGYLISAALAFAAVALIAYFRPQDIQDASSGMYAFGDAILFLAVSSMASIVPTAFGLYFLRPYRQFWIAFLSVGIVFTLGGLIASGVYISLSRGGMGEAAGIAVLRLLLAPFLAGAYFLGGVFAPTPRFRLALFGITALEVLSFAFVFLFGFFSA